MSAEDNSTKDPKAQRRPSASSRNVVLFGFLVVGLIFITYGLDFLYERLEEDKVLSSLS